MEQKGTETGKFRRLGNLQRTYFKRRPDKTSRHTGLSSLNKELDETVSQGPLHYNTHRASRFLPCH